MLFSSFASFCHSHKLNRVGIFAHNILFSENTESIIFADICLQPPTDGVDYPFVLEHCDTLWRRWIFNQVTGKCESIVDNLCGRTENNFLTETECQKRCGGHINICQKASTECVIDRSGIEARRWTFNHVDGKCESIVNLACSRTENNFENEKECQKHCGYAKF